MGSFIKTREQIQSLQGSQTIFYGAQVVNFAWETKPEILAKILPAPLKLLDGKPYVSAFVANYPKLSFAPPYKEAGLFILCECDGFVGRYCLSMPITNDIAMAMGREVLGLPKKMADIQFHQTKEKISGALARNGITFFNFSVDLKEEKEGDQDKVKEATNPYIYDINYTKGVDAPYSFIPTLCRFKLSLTEITQNQPCSNIQIKMTDSPHDPWAELEVVRMLGANYVVSTNILEEGVNLHQHKIDPLGFVPYSFLRWDWWGK